jgi:hypothetical protein
MYAVDPRVIPNPSTLGALTTVFKIIKLIKLGIFR